MAADINKQPTTLDGEIRRAQLLRSEGNLKGAIKALAQLMLVSPDDPRIVGEYGKVLAQQGRSTEAQAFLNRAIELQPDNWSFYSALGVTYDQQHKPSQAQAAYKHALRLNPKNAVVLNNYGMSQMMAGNLDQADKLLHEAAAQGSTNSQIAANLKMIAAKRSEHPDVAVARAKAPKLREAPIDVARKSAPRQLIHKPAEKVATTRPRVIMEKMPRDPLAGKVYGKPTTSAQVASTKAGKAKQVADDKPATSQAPERMARQNAPALRTAADLY